MEINEPKISATADIIEETYGSIVVPAFWNINNAYEMMIKLGENCTIVHKAKPIPSPFNADRLPGGET